MCHVSECKGDTIAWVNSPHIPSDINIGIVESAKLTDNGSRYDIEIRLFNNMTDLGYVYVIKRDTKAIQ
jgi:rod shape-determining protein MreC